MGRPKKEMKLVTIAARIHPAIFDELKEQATTDNVTISDVIRIRIQRT